MQTLDFDLLSTVRQTHIAPCSHCRQSFDLFSAAACTCIARERTFACPRCGSCACDASFRERTEFWKTAPAALWTRRRREQAEGIARLEALDASSLPRPFALIIDDDPLVLAVAARTLRAMGFTTMTNGNAEEALAIAMTILPDLILTDALMPRLDGRELCLRLKSDERTSAITIIVMSALYRGTAYRNEAFRAFRVDEYLAKPVTAETLREAVGRLMPAVLRAAPDSNYARSAS